MRSVEERINMERAGNSEDADLKFRIFVREQKGTGLD